MFRILFHHVCDHKEHMLILLGESNNQQDMDMDMERM